MKNSKIIKIISFLTSSLLMLFLLSGCFLFEPSDESSKVDVDSGFIPSEEEVLPEDEKIIENEEVVEIATIAEEEDEVIESDENEEKDVVENLELTTISIKVYYIDEQAQYLIGEGREISGRTKEEFIVSAFGELLKEPQSENIYNLIPKGTKIIEAEYVDNYAILNLSKEFIDNKVEDGLVDLLLLNCISATITEIPDVKGVLFEVEDKKINIYGTIDVSIPVKRNNELLK